MCESKDDGYFPLSTMITDYGFFVKVNSLDIQHSFDGNYYNIFYSKSALKTSLKYIKGKYSALEYDGYIAHCSCDVRCGEFWDWILSSKKPSYEGSEYVAMILSYLIEDTNYLREIGIDLEGIKIGEIYKEEFSRILCDYTDYLAYDLAKTILFLYDNARFARRSTLNNFIKMLIDALPEEPDEEVIEILRKLESGEKIETVDEISSKEIVDIRISEEYSNEEYEEVHDYFWQLYIEEKLENPKYRSLLEIKYD